MYYVASGSLDASGRTLLEFQWKFSDDDVVSVLKPQHLLQVPHFGRRKCRHLQRHKQRWRRPSPYKANQAKKSSIMKNPAQKNPKNPCHGPWVSVYCSCRTHLLCMARPWWSGYVRMHIPALPAWAQRYVDSATGQFQCKGCGCALHCTYSPHQNTPMLRCYATDQPLVLRTCQPSHACNGWRSQLLPEIHFRNWHGDARVLSASWETGNLIESTKEYVYNYLPTEMFNGDCTDRKSKLWQTDGHHTPSYQFGYKAGLPRILERDHHTSRPLGIRATLGSNDNWMSGHVMTTIHTH